MARGGGAARSVCLGWLIVLAATARPSPAAAQPQISLARAGVQYMPTSRIASEDGADVAAVRLAATARAPVALSRALVMMVAPQYRYWRFFSDDVPEHRIHELAVSVGLRARLSDAWALIATVGTGVASDFEDVDAEHLRNTAALLADYTLSPQLQLGFGAASTYTFGETLVLPLLVAVWQPTPAVQIGARLPEGAHVSYRLGDRLQAGLRFQVEGNRFSVTQGRVRRSLSVSVGGVLAEAAVRLVGPLWLVGSGGATVFRRIEPFDDQGDSLGDVSGETAPLFGLALEVRVDRPPSATPGPSPPGR